MFQVRFKLIINKIIFEDDSRNIEINFNHVTSIIIDKESLYSNHCCLSFSFIDGTKIHLEFYTYSDALEYKNALFTCGIANCKIKPKEVIYTK